MPDIISEKDPKGLRITCSEKQWKEHIISGHPIMKENLEAVIDTIKSPNYIYESKDSDPPDSFRLLYTKSATSATYYSKGVHTRVVVNIDGGYGTVVTAYPVKQFTSGIKEGKEAIYIAERYDET